METDGHFAQRLLVRLGGVVGVVCVTLALAPAAAAAPPPRPGQIAAIDQYYETFPTSSGGQLTGRGAAPAGGGTPLPPALEARIREQAGPDAQTLIDLAATSPAPSDENAPAAGAGDEASGEAAEQPRTVLPAPDEPSFAEALTEATGAPATSRGWLLLAVVLATAAALAAMAFRQRRAASERD
jgi:hypothetical protein